MSRSTRRRYSRKSDQRKFWVIDVYQTIAAMGDEQLIKDYCFLASLGYWIQCVDHGDGSFDYIVTVVAPNSSIVDTPTYFDRRFNTLSNSYNGHTTNGYRLILDCMLEDLHCRI